MSEQPPHPPQSPQPPQQLEIRYRLAGKALPPRPIKLELPGWAGSPDLKREMGSEPQPWHCQPFTDASTYGLELVYHYETECHVVNNGNDIEIQWDYRKEPGGVLGSDEFNTAAPKPSRSYMFATSVDLEAPPGYVLRTEPHPRFYTDETGTAPCAIAAHVQSEWWAKKLFVVFKSPDVGKRHIFRKGEPYVQILFVPQRMSYPVVRMTPEQEARRGALEEGIKSAKSYIAKRVWYNPAGNEFNDHYKVLARAFAQEGRGAVADVVRQAVEHDRHVIPPGKTFAEYLALGEQYQREGKYVEAKATLLHARTLAPNNPAVWLQMGGLAQSVGLTELGLNLMRQAVALDPNSVANRRHLGKMLKKAGLLAEAETHFRAALRLVPNDPQTLTQLGLTLAAQGRTEEGLQMCRSALAGGSHLPVVHVAIGSILARQGKPADARASYEAALAIDPQFAPARRRLEEAAAPPL